MKNEIKKDGKQIYQLLVFLIIEQNMLDKNKKLKATMDSTKTDTEVFLENSCS